MMSKKQFAIICVLLSIIIALLIYIIYQNNSMVQDTVNALNHISDKIDILTGKVNGLK